MARAALFMGVGAAAALFLLPALVLSTDNTAAGPTLIDLLSPSKRLLLSDASLQLLNTSGNSASNARASSRARAGSIPTMTSYGSANRYQKPYNICISDWTPMVECFGVVQPEDYTGYMVELMRYMADDLGWQDGDWFMHCMSWTDFNNDLLDPNGNCFMVAAAQEISTYNYDSGLKYAQPIYRTGLQAMIHAKISPPNPWAFTNVFSWQVWLGMGITSVCIAFLLWILEKWNHACEKWDPISKHHQERDLHSWTWFSITKLMHVSNSVGDPHSWAGRALVLAYGFLVLIMLHIYTAASAVQLTAETVSAQITNLNDLQGKAVITWEFYVPPLAKRSLFPDGAPWLTDSDLQSMVSKVKSGQYTAMVMDVLTTRYLSTTDPDCTLQLLGEPFEPYHAGITFANDADQQLIDIVDKSILHLQGDYALMDLLDTLFTKGANTQCGKGLSAGGGGGHGTSAVPFGRVAGLWVILGASAGFAVVLVCLQNILYKEPVADASSPVVVARKSSLLQASVGTIGADSDAVPQLHLQQIQLHVQELKERVQAAAVKTPRSARGGASSSKRIGFAVPEGGVSNSASGNTPSARTGGAVPFLPGATNSSNRSQGHNRTLMDGN